MNLFSTRRALRMAHHVGSAYAGMSPRVENLATDTQCGIYREDDAFIVAFPGTASRRDVITDLRCAKLPFAAGRVHAGFRSAFDSIFDDVAAALPPGEPVIVCGHSLGGALALLAAFRLSEAGAKIESVYTFGQPRVGNGPFARAYDRRLGNLTWRIVNARDPVPHVPWMLGTYRHCGREVFLPEDGPIQIERGWWSVLSEKLTLLPDGEAHREFLSHTAHTLHAYIARLAHA